MGILTILKQLIFDKTKKKAIDMNPGFVNQIFSLRGKILYKACFIKHQ